MKIQDIFKNNIWSLVVGCVYLIIGWSFFSYQINANTQDIVSLKNDLKALKTEIATNQKDISDRLLIIETKLDLYFKENFSIHSEDQKTN